MSAAADPTLLPDPTWVRLDATTVLAGSPVRMFRVTAAGRRVLDAVEQGGALPIGHAALTDRLLAAGAVHPAPRSRPPVPGEVTVVVPAHGETPDRLAAVLAPLRGLPAVVVDDASPEPVVMADPDVQVIRLGTNRGPAAARNAGLVAVTTPFVLFVDADASIGLDAVATLLGALADERVAAVAPRVRAATTRDGVLDRYEAARSPLDMGSAPALVRAGTRVSYVPAAVLLCRTDAVRAAGGFDETLRYGEDVDLVWRLDAAGTAVRYEPAAVASHVVRPSLGRLLRQRYGYGTAAGPLERRHPGALAPVRVGPWALGAWLTAGAGHPIAGALVAGGSLPPLARQLAGPDGRPRWDAAARVAVTGNAHAGRQLADATTSVWLPGAAVAALVSRRARRTVAAAMLVPAVLEWFDRRPRLDPVRFTAIRTLERAAYGAGVVRGAIGVRRAGPLRPVIERRTRRGAPGARPGARRRQ